MRNFRKTRKRGGVNTSIVLICEHPYATMGKCETEFLKQYNFKKYRVPGDGNCFYHALSKYYSLSNPGRNDNPTHLELRERVVGLMTDKFEEVKVVLMENIPEFNNSIMNMNTYESIKNVKYSEVFEALEELAEDGVWDSNNADLVSQYTSRALNVQLNIFDKKQPEKAKRKLLSRFNNGTEIYQNYPPEPGKIIRYSFEPDEPYNHNTIETINLLRVSDAHYELLYPKDAINEPVVSRGRRKTVKSNILNNMVNNLGILKLNNKSTIGGPNMNVLGNSNRIVGRYSLRSRKEAVKQVPRRTPSPPKRKTVKAKKISNENREAAELQAAIEASLANTHKPLPNNFYNAFNNFK